MPTNVLLIHSDQHRWDCVGRRAHHPQLRTPNLDRLAAEGVDFTNAHTPSPICTPARASLLTGQWPHQHGVLSIPPTEVSAAPHRTSLPPDADLLWTRLKDAGYRQGHVGKWHNETEHPPSHYLDDYVHEDEYFPWRKQQGIPDQPEANVWFGETDPHVDKDTHRLGWEADHVTRLLDEYKADGRPFMLRWDPSEPHLPNRVPPEVAAMYPSEDCHPWDSYPDPLDGKPYIQHQQRRTWGVDDWTWDDWQPIVSRYLGEITHMDEMIGRVLDRLDDLGLAEDTLVIYSTDHGDLCGGHGMIDKHFILYDEVTRVPLTMRLPSRLPAGRVCEEWVTHEIDLARTIVNLCTGETPESFKVGRGVDLLPVAAGDQTTGRDEIYGQWFGGQFGLYSQRMIRDGRYKLIHNATAEDELYDLEADPGEVTNLAADPTHQDTLMRLRGRLLAWMQELKDPLLNYFTRPQLTKPGVKV